MKKVQPSKKVEPEYVAIGFQGEDETEEVEVLPEAVPVGEEELSFPSGTMTPLPPLETQYTFCGGADPGCATKTPKAVRRSRAKVALCRMATL